MPSKSEYRTLEKPPQRLQSKMTVGTASQHHPLTEEMKIGLSCFAQLNTKAMEMGFGSFLCIVLRDWDTEAKKNAIQQSTAVPTTPELVGTGSTGGNSDESQVSTPTTPALPAKTEHLPKKTQKPSRHQGSSCPFTNTVSEDSSDPGIPSMKIDQGTLSLDSGGAAIIPAVTTSQALATVEGYHSVNDTTRIDTASHIEKKEVPSLTGDPMRDLGGYFRLMSKNWLTRLSRAS